MQWRSEGGGRNGPARASIRRDGKIGKNGRGDNGKIVVIRGHRAFHHFWGRQNCSLPRAPITHAAAGNVLLKK